MKNTFKMIIHGCEFNNYIDPYLKICVQSPIDKNCSDAGDTRLQPLSNRRMCGYAFDSIKALYSVGLNRSITVTNNTQ